MLLGAVAVGGLWLVLFGGDGGGEATDSADGTLELTDTDAQSVSELAGLELPESTADFLTARLDDDTQLDVTFTIDPDDEPSFVEGSGLAPPSTGERVIFHASPLWELNAEGPVRGSTDTSPGKVDPTSEHQGVSRAVELVDEGELVRVRLVLSPA